ncbi:MAG: YkgJ family cysteine cluster protein [Desulfobulbaceae bacterium]|nr:YkgJ family cysteine cluster protein [Desulfobulbaceae bacterium]
MTIVQQTGFDFYFDTDACCECGGFCCRGRSGQVWIDEHDARRIGGFLKISTIDFMLRFTIRVNNRLSLRERYIAGQYACIFFDAGTETCSIYQVRPEQCRRFPFWDYFREHKEELKLECPGIRERD